MHIRLQAQTTPLFGSKEDLSLVERLGERFRCDAYEHVFEGSGSLGPALSIRVQSRRAALAENKYNLAENQSQIAVVK